MNVDKIHSSSPMDEQKIESLWSECFQDLGSWCHQPQDELNTPNVINQNEFNFSFDDQSMYNPWEASTSSLDTKGDMWKPQLNADLLSLQFTSEEDNNNTLMQTETTILDGDTKEPGIRYTGNLLLTQCPYTIDQDIKNNIKQETWNESSQKLNTGNQLQYDTFKSQTSLTARTQSNLMKTDRSNRAVMNTSKPSLKLNIAAANKPSTSSDVAAPFSMNTPEVFKSLSDNTSNFSLVEYVCEGFEDATLLGVDPSSIISQKPKEPSQLSEQIIKIDHDYLEILPSEELDCQENELPTIKEEIESKLFPLAVKEEPCSPSTSTSLGKRVRKSTTAQSDDYIFDDDPSSDLSSSDWSPLAKKKYKSTKKKGNVNKTKRIRTSSVSDSSSVTSGPDRYRELRDRNNEASRRSRMNRKQREVEMMDTASQLQKENVQLKVRAASLEKRVKSLREILLKVVIEKNKNTSL